MEVAKIPAEAKRGKLPSARHVASATHRDGKIRPLPVDPKSEVTWDRNWKVRVTKESKILGLPTEPLVRSPRELSGAFAGPRRPISADRSTLRPKMPLRRWHSVDSAPKMVSYKSVTPPAGLRPMLSQAGGRAIAAGQLGQLSKMGSNLPAGALSPREQRLYALGAGSERPSGQGAERTLLSPKGTLRSARADSGNQKGKPLQLPPTTMRTTAAPTSGVQYGSWEPRALGKEAKHGVVINHHPGQGNTVSDAEMNFLGGASGDGSPARPPGR